MATENNWLKSNIEERLTNPNAQFIVRFDHVDFTSISFTEACKNVVNKLAAKYDNLFIPLSGGMDSEFVFNCFFEAGHKFTPIIVDTPANKEESAYAFRRCKESNITPVVIEKTETELLELYYEEIYKKIRGIGYNATTAYLAGKYADDNGGVAIIAEHGFDGFNEHDFYNDALIHIENSVYFFMYDMQIFSAMLESYRPGENHQIFKQKLYGIQLRPKMKYTYTEDVDKMFKQIRNNIPIPKTLVRYGTL